jgi:hypothetical protein
MLLVGGEMEPQAGGSEPLQFGDEVEIKLSIHPEPVVDEFAYRQMGRKSLQDRLQSRLKRGATVHHIIPMPLEELRPKALRREAEVQFKVAVPPPRLRADNHAIDIDHQDLHPKSNRLANKV